jgi:phosphoglycerol transferase MdoB-like AlkP superfamily enzyme
MMQIKLSKSILWNTLLGSSYLILMSVLRIAFIYQFNNPETSSQPLKSAFILGLRFDLRYVAIIMIVSFLISIIKPLNPFENKIGKKIIVAIWMIFSFLIVFFYTADFLHFAYLKQRLNANVLTYLENFAISAKMMWQTYPVVIILLAACLLMFLFYKYIQYTFKLIQDTSYQGVVKRRWIQSLLFIIILAYSAIGNIVYSGGQYPLRWSDAYALGSDYIANVSLNPIQSFFSTLDFRDNKIDTKKIKDNYNLISDYLMIPADQRDVNTLKFSRNIVPIQGDTLSPKIKNVVLVICESFACYKSSISGNPLNTTPYFKQMCEEGVFFNRAFSPSYGTARGVWAAITGIPDVQAGRTSSRNPAAVDQHSIFNDFKKHDKYYFLGGSTSWANIRGLLSNNISDLTIFEQGKYNSREVDVWGISDKNLFFEANKTLKTKKDPFFAIIQTADNHRPYTIPTEDIGEFKKRTVSSDSLKMFGFESNDELNAFRYADYCIQQFIESAKKEAYFKNTLFVFVGDHGLKGDAGNILPRLFSEQNLTYMHIPLLFYAPGILKNKEYDIPVSQVDVLPSIASLCNIPYTNTTMGRNVFDVVNQFPNNGIFLYDDFLKVAGMYTNDAFYKYQTNSPATNYFERQNKNVPTEDAKRKNELKVLTETMYETSKYMLINNHKN